MRHSKTMDPTTQSCDAGDEELIGLSPLKADRNKGNYSLRSTVPVTIVEDQ